MQKVNLKNQSELEPLVPLKVAMLDNIMRAFFQSFSDINVQKNAIKGFTISYAFLKKVYNLAEEARKTKIEFGKLFEKQMRVSELSFYKQLAEKNFPKHQLEAFLTYYHTKASLHPHSNKQQAFWSVYADLAPSY